jgi:hypothetical protein
LKDVIGEQGRPWEVRLVNLQEILDPLDVFRKITGLRLQDIYNNLLRKGWTLGTPQLLRLMQQVIRLYHPAQVKLLSEFWRHRAPDLVVSLVPNFNRACRRLKPPGGGAFVTLLTDLLIIRRGSGWSRRAGSDLRYRQGGRAGAGHGALAGARASRFGHGPPAAVLSAG